MPATGARRGPVVVDAQALQAPSSRARGIGRYAADLVTALERHRPQLVGTYLLNPDLPPPSPLAALYESGKLAWRGDPGAIGDGARVLHLLSPLDVELDVTALWPAGAERLALSATVYDLIPAHDPERYLTDEVARRRYRTRLELVRNAAGLQVLSDAVADDLESLLGVDPGRITRVGAAVGERFTTPSDRGRARAAAIGRGAAFGLTAPYVLYPSGTHPRKNNEALVAAFARVVSARDDKLQLVIAGEFPDSTVAHFAHLAAGFEIAGRVVTPGYLDDADYAALVRGAELVCVPSLAEGFGLPLAEAIACGTPVIASDRPPFGELVRPEARFDPGEPEAIAAAILRALEPEAATRPVVALPGWDVVAARAADALERLVPRELVRSSRRRRPRLALVSPFPPSPSGVAGYSNELARALTDLGTFEVVLFGDGPAAHQRGPGATPVHPPRALRTHEALEGTFDHVCYTLGNSHHHLEALQLLRERRGVVLAHDVRLTNLYRHLHGDPGFALGGLGAEVRAMYRGGLPRDVGATGALDPADASRYGVLMAREAIERSTRFLVSSRAAAALALSDAGDGLTERIGVLPFAFFETGREHPFEEDRRPAPDGLDRSARWWGRAPTSEIEGAVLCHFGIVDPAKEPEVLLEVLAELHASGHEASLVLVGPVGDALASDLAARARLVGLDGAFGLTGPLPPAAYRAWLERADLAIQLRRSFNGEASAALGDCLGAGVATIVRATGFFAELPDDAVAKVAPHADPSSIARTVRAVLAEPSARARLSARARAVAAERTFAATAAALGEELERRARAESASA